MTLIVCGHCKSKIDTNRLGTGDVVWCHCYTTRVDTYGNKVSIHSKLFELRRNEIQ